MYMGTNSIRHAHKGEDFRFVALLKACARKKDPQEGAMVHAAILQHGALLDRSPHLACSLISMYAKCGAIAKARRVLDHLPYRNVACWNALISGYAQQGLGREALACFSQMRDEGFDPSAVTFLCALKACGSIGAIDAGERIHEEIVEKDLLATNVALGTSLVDMYAKCGMVGKAELIHAQLRARDVVSWTALIAGYAQQEDRGREALNCFEAMKRDGVCPNAITLTFALKACAACGDVAKGREIHGEIASRRLLESEVVLATALVDMYAKCGLFAKAWETLRELPARNVVTWNALIAGYAEHGPGHESSLDLILEQMQREGFSPDVVTFLSVLKACGSSAAVGMGKQMHAEIISKGLMDANPSLGNALVDMYARCHRLEEAQDVHDHLRVRDVVSWSTLIAGYVQQGQDEEALDRFDSMMQGGNVAPNAVTFAYVLKACGGIGAIEKGKQIHDKISRSRAMLCDDVVLGNALVEMYAKCGHLTKARRVLEEELPARDVASWSALISGYAQQGKVHEALDCFSRMAHEQISPNAATYAYILKACASARAIHEGKRIHNEIIRGNVFRADVVVGNALLDMYAKCGFLTEAHHVLEDLPRRDVVTWSAMIAGYAEHGQGHKALDCYERMQGEGIDPNQVTFASILKAIGIIRALGKGEEVREQICGESLWRKDTMIGTALVDMYAKCDALLKAQQVHDELDVRDTVSWNALISGYVESGRSREAMSCFEQMQNEGLPPDSSTFVCILKACSDAGCIRMGQRIHSEALTKGLLDKDAVLGTALIDMYAKCDLLRKAQRMHDSLPSHDAVSWSALIAGYARQGECKEALNLFASMQGMGLSPNVVTFISILKACGSIGAIDKGREIHDRALADGGLSPWQAADISLGNALIDMYAKCGAFSKASQVLQDLPVRNVVSWSSLIAGYAHQGRSDEALAAFELMRIDGVPPDAIAFVCILNACSQSGLLGEAQMCYDCMVGEFGIMPGLEHHTCMVMALGCGGFFDGAMSVVIGAYNTPSNDLLPVWLAVLGACQKWGNVKLGKLAFEQATRLDADCAPAYALMASILY